MSWPQPQAWLYAWVDTDAPGYRQVEIASASITVAAGYRRWPDYVSAINTAVGAVSGSYSCVAGSSGGLRLTGAAHIVWPDRMGWLLGMQAEPGTDEGSATYVDSREVAPGAIPLLAATWKTIDRKSEEKLMVDRHLRGHGYLYGGADVWRWRVLMHASAVPSFRAGFALSGKVTIAATAPSSWGSASAWSKTNTDGFVDGHILGISGGSWIDPTRTIWETHLLIATTVNT